MADVTIGVLHPGEMGSAVAACARASGARVVWAAEGRGADTRRRAAAARIEDVVTLSRLARESDVIVSVCPPGAALAVARAVAAHAPRGIYVDANAVSPSTAREIGGVVEESGSAFVDGGIVGPPPVGTGTTRLYLSGKESARIAALFEGSALEAVALDGPAGAASALKMAFAAYTKGTAALLMSIRALARAEGVDEALVSEWRRSHPELPARSEDAVRGTARKAWRFVGEMEEIASSFSSAGLPAGFHRAAAEVYQRLACYKTASAPPSVTEASAALLQTPASPSG